MRAEVCKRVGLRLVVPLRRFGRYLVVGWASVHILWQVLLGSFCRGIVRLAWRCVYEVSASPATVRLLPPLFRGPVGCGAR